MIGLGHTPKFSIITPCRNSAVVIGETIDSVLQQSALLAGRAELEYIICDGVSTDDTLEIVKKYSDQRIKISSVLDRSMYDALARGLSIVTGDICAYINAGDYYHRTAFDVVIDVFRMDNVQWLTGMSVFYNEKGQVTRCDVPFKFRTQFIQKGLYGTILPFIQQESTFWASSLLSLLDLDKLAHCRLAGDSLLWQQFSKAADLYIVDSYLGGFRETPGQLSSNIEAYREELATFSLPRCLSLADRLRIVHDRLGWHLPRRLKKRLNPQTLLVYNSEARGFV